MEKSFQEIQDMLTDRWSNNACCGYVIKAMENCGFKSKDISQVLTELYEVFDFCAVEEAAAIMKTGSPDLGPSWPEAWRKTKERHFVSGVAL